MNSIIIFFFIIFLLLLIYFNRYRFRKGFNKEIPDTEIMYHTANEIESFIQKYSEYESKHLNQLLESGGLSKNEIMIIQKILTDRQ